jgi:hypothetical protein
MASPQQTLPAPTIDLLLNLIDTRPSAILAALAQHPQLAAAADAHGYSLVHAAASYHQLDVLRELVRKYNVDVDKLDEDGESALFVAEQGDVARCLVEELGADCGIRNAEGKTAEDKIAEEEGVAHEVCRYLRSLRGGPQAQPVSAAAAETDGVHPPPPLPNGVQINVGTMAEDAAGEAPDPEIRRRIEELASRDDFQTDEVQRQLRDLIADVVTGMSTEDSGRGVRRRVD